MRLTLRTKLLGIVTITGVAFVAVFVVSSLIADRVESELSRMRDVYVPLVGLGPKLEGDFAGMTRSYQDAVAALDLDALAGARARVDGVLAALDAADGAVDPHKATQFRAALEAYHEVAAEVSRRIISGETGEDIITAMATMQVRQKEAAEQLRALTLLDRDALSRAFTSVAEAQATANDVRLVVSLASMALVLLMSLALARGALRALGALDAGLERFGRGEFDVPIPIMTNDDELARVAERANEMARRLDQLASARRKTDWLEAGHAGLMRTLRGELTPDQVAARALEFLTSYLEAPFASLYETDGDGRMQVRARLPEREPRALLPDPDLVGETALGHEIVVVTVASAAAPSHVLVPLVRASRVSGLVELARTAPWTELDRELLFATRESLAIALEVARAQDELRKKNVEIATVSTYKSRFLTNMSHELRTPLNSMLLLSNLLAENETKNLSDKQVEFSRTIYTAGKELLALINQVLDLAKVESGKQHIRLGPARLADLAQRAQRVFEPLAHDKGLSLVVEVAPNTPEAIWTDQQRVDQILTNLLGNAIKFSPSGTVVLRIGRAPAGTSLRRTDLRAEAAIALVVSDTGPGIAESDQERVFAPFEQLDAEVDRRYGGTGLGLALARELAGLLGGELHLHSALGIGSTFTCYLPDRAPPVDTPAPSPRVQPPPPSGEPSLLIIEDDVEFARTFGEVARGFGIAHRVTSSGAEGLRMAQEAPPRGVVLDVRLPDTDGFDVMARLRSNPATASVPVYFVSGVDAPEHGLALGALGYMVKPAGRRDLVRVLEALIPEVVERARRVLFVEDDPVTGEILSKMLGHEHLEATRVSTAEAALRELEEATFGCMIVDLGLPDMDGLALLEQVRARHGDKAPSVVVYTARELSPDERRGLEAHAEAVIAKGDGDSVDRVVTEIRLFVRRLKEGLAPRRGSGHLLPPGDHGLRDKKVLVVDDDMRTVYALSAALRAKGMEVHVADSGHAVLAALDLRPSLDLVLMDIRMRGLDGLETMRRIRADARFATLPIIALTAKAMKGDEDAWLAAGASAYLPKPIDATRLLGLMQAQLERRTP